MKTILNWNSLIVLLLIIAVSCIARSVKNQTNKLSCAETYSILTICPNSVNGSINFGEPYINDCTTIIIDMHMNLTDITDALYFHHYRGNITMECGTNDIFNYTISGHVYFGDFHFNGTASVCNDHCDDVSFEGGYEMDANKSTCHEILAGDFLCY